MSRFLRFGAAFSSLSLIWAQEALATSYEIGPADNLASAIQALVPGDELVLGGGSYVLSGYFEIAVSGTAGQPIVIRAKDGEVPVIEQQAQQNIVNVLGSYLEFRGLEFTGGSRGIRVQTGSFITVEDCHIHHTGANAISVNDSGVDYAGIILRRNHIHDTGGVGEGMYLGCNNNGCQFHDSLIEGNWIHDTNGPTVDQGDGIEIKEGSYGNIVRDNVIHDTGYPCIITYSTLGNGPPNIIERNALWGCGDHGIQSAADVVIRNNIILSAAADGIRNQPHQSGEPANIEIVHNTVLKASGDALRSDGIVGSVLIANNALYAQSGNALRVAGDLTGVTVSGNVGVGSLQGVSAGFSASGSLTDFVAASFSGAPPNDVFPSASSALLGAADVGHLASDDFNGTARDGQLDVGAYNFDAAGNPGWTLQAGFKTLPTPSGSGGAGAGGGSGSGGSGAGAGSSSGGAGPSAGGAAAGGAGGAGGGGASDDGEGCDCRSAGANSSAHNGWFGGLVALLFLGRLRRRHCGGSKP